MIVWVAVQARFDRGLVCIVFVVGSIPNRVALEAMHTNSCCTQSGGKIRLKCTQRETADPTGSDVSRISWRLVNQCG